MHGRPREGGLLLSTLHSGHAGLPRGKAAASAPKARNPALPPFCAATASWGGGIRDVRGSENRPASIG